MTQTRLKDSNLSMLWKRRLWLIAIFQRCWKLRKLFQTKNSTLSTLCKRWVKQPFNKLSSHMLWPHPAVTCWVFMLSFCNWSRARAWLMRCGRSNTGIARPCMSKGLSLGFPREFQSIAAWSDTSASFRIFSLLCFSRTLLPSFLSSAMILVTLTRLTSDSDLDAVN